MNTEQMTKLVSEMNHAELICFAGFVIGASEIIAKAGIGEILYQRKVQLERDWGFSDE
jgi:hypothetical protein